jgi:hypothetical protein
MRNVIWAVVVVLWAGNTACKSSSPATPEPSTTSARDSKPEPKGDTMIDQDKARSLALDEIKKRGKDPARYDITLQETDAEWTVEVVGKEPRPPGDELMVYVNKRTGALRVMQGE